MTDQHRATPEQWEHLKNGAQMERPYNSALCILELRARIEALEAAQLGQAESHRFCTDAIVRRVEALELAHRIQSGTLTSAERAELGVVPAVDLEAAVHRAAAEARDAAMTELRAASAEARPTVKDSLTDGGSLLEMVAKAIYNVPHDSAAEARAAIREVAKWLRSEYPRREGFGTAWANLIEQEADRG